MKEEHDPHRVESSSRKNQVRFVGEFGLNLLSFIMRVQQ